MVPVGLVTSLVTGEVRSVLAFCAWSTLVASEVSDVGMQGVGSGMPGFIVEPWCLGVHWCLGPNSMPERKGTHFQAL